MDRKLRPWKLLPTEEIEVNGRKVIVNKGEKDAYIRSVKGSRVQVQDTPTNNRSDKGELQLVVEFLNKVSPESDIWNEEGYPEPVKVKEALGDAFSIEVVEKGIKQYLETL